MEPGKPVPRHIETAKMLDELAAWIDTELAAGQPPKWVGRVAAVTCRYIAARVRVEGGRHR
jgi:hypothetical protein